MQGIETNTNKNNMSQVSMHSFIQHVYSWKYKLKNTTATQRSYEHASLQKQVHSDNDASEVEILGHFGTCWDILGQFERHLDI